MAINTDILKMIGDVVEANMRQEILKPRQSRGYDGQAKKSTALSPRVFTGRLVEDLQVTWDIQANGNVRMVFEFPNTPEWYFVDQGRRGKKQNPSLKYPPLSVIATWTRGKPLPQFRDKLGRWISNKQRNFLVQRSIGELGYQGIHFIEKSIEKSLNDIEVNFGIYGRTYLEEIINQKIIIRTRTNE